MMRDKGGDGPTFMKNFLDAGYRVKSEDGSREYSREELMDRKTFKKDHDLVFEYKGQEV